MTMPSMDDDKTVWRRWARARRDGLSAEERRVRSQALGERLWAQPGFAASRTLLMYGSIASEVHTWPLLARLLAENRCLLMPRVNPEDHTLQLYRVRDLERDLLPPALWGLREPNPQRCVRVEPAAVECILVPGLLFDQEGYRLGYGGGYYDRLLARPDVTGLRLALAFREQLVAHLPHAAHDLPVSTWVTDEP